MKDKFITAVAIAAVALFIINIVALAVFYKKYTTNLDAVNQQAWLNKVKIENLEKNSDSFKEAIDGFNAQMKNYDSNIASLEKLVNSAETGSKEVAAKMQSVKLDMDEWQNKLSNTIAQILELKDKTQAINDNIEQLKKQALGSSVDLGKISVDSSQSSSTVSTT